MQEVLFKLESTVHTLNGIDLRVHRWEVMPKKGVRRSVSDECLSRNLRLRLLRVSWPVYYQTGMLVENILETKLIVKC